MFAPPPLPRLRLVNFWRIWLWRTWFRILWWMRVQSARSQLIWFQILWIMSELHDDCTLPEASWFNSRSSGEWVSFMMTALFARSHMQFLLFIFHWWIVFALEGVYSIQKYKAFIIALVGPGEQLYIIKLQNLYIIKGWKITNMFLQQGEPQFGQ